MIGVIRVIRVIGVIEVMRVKRVIWLIWVISDKLVFLDLNDTKILIILPNLNLNRSNTTLVYAQPCGEALPNSEALDSGFCVCKPGYYQTSGENNRYFVLFGILLSYYFILISALSWQLQKRKNANRAQKGSTVQDIHLALKAVQQWESVRSVQLIPKRNMKLVHR